MDLIKYRFYKNKVPNINDIVMIQVIEETELNFYVELLEYNNIKGILPFTFLTSRKKLKNMKDKKIVKVGDIIPVCVNNNVIENDFIYVSEMHVKDKEVVPFIKKYETYDKINKLGRDFYCFFKYYHKLNNINFDTNIESFMEKTIWKLYDNNSSEQDIYTIIIKNPLEHFTDQIFTEQFKLFLCDNLNKRTTKKDMIAKLSIELYIISSDGVKAIKDILNLNLDEQYNNYKLSVILNSPPKYSIILEGESFEKSKEIFENLIIKIKNKIKKYNGNVNFLEPIIIKENLIEIKLLSNHDINNMLS